MALVVWVFAGGGEAEVAGLIPFLQENFRGCKFERKTPAVSKPGSKPGRGSYGRTGRSLREQITQELPIALRYQPNECNLILVFDDLDCREPVKEKEEFLNTISAIPESHGVEKLISFAAPELEAWIIADWDNSVARHPDFRGRREGMRWWLSTQVNVPFDHPESFSEYDSDKDCCREKLSKALIDSTVLDEFGSDSIRYSKGLHTPNLLQNTKMPFISGTI
jgi:hypothetical protein